MIKKLFGWGKVDHVVEGKPVEQVPIYNIAMDTVEVWEEDDNYYQELTVGYLEDVVTGRKSLISLGDINYMRRCYGLPTINAGRHHPTEAYMLTVWFYDKCKEIYFRGK